MSTKQDCVCEWNDDDEVISFCGAHMELHRKMIAKLEERDRLLGCLEAAGVDNWDGFDYAHEMMEEGE